MREAISKHKLGWILRGLSILSFGVGLTLAGSPDARAAQSATLAWNPASGAGVAGYVIHYGVNTTNTPIAIDVGTNTVWTVSGLHEGDTNYFVVTAYDASHVESPPSNGTYFYVHGVIGMGARAQARQAAALNFPVAPGHTYQVQASTDLQRWTTIWQTTSVTNAWVQFHDPSAVNLRSRFYRTVTY